MRPKPHFDIAPQLFGFRTVLVNLYFVGSLGPEKSWVLVDAGIPGYSADIIEQAAKHFGQNTPPAAIVLTHGHFDHVGSLSALMRRWSVPVHAHALELPFLNERRPYPPPDPTVGGGFLATSSTLFPRVSSLPKKVLPLPDDGSVPGLPDWRWIATPGHSPGHVSLWRESDRALIAGDALITTRQESVTAVWNQTVEVRPPPAYFTSDWRAAYESMEKLYTLSPEVLASGHGLPLHGDAWRRELSYLLADFPHRGLPPRGKYVRETWPAAQPSAAH